VPLLLGPAVDELSMTPNAAAAEVIVRAMKNERRKSPRRQALQQTDGGKPTRLVEASITSRKAE